ncbi:MAG: response regulator [Sedimentisphaerales bacterium]|nr:response regulator [Sedimentisphaerales bacterium]
MMQRLSQPESVNVLISDANWAWPQAVNDIFRPRGINALVVDCAEDLMRIFDSRRIHLALLDSEKHELTGIQALKIIRQRDLLVPCILLARQAGQRLLAEALALKVFSVVAKPVDLSLLAAQIDRLFLKYYASNLFSTPDTATRWRLTVKHIRLQTPNPDPHERSKNQNEDQTFS